MSCSWARAPWCSPAASQPAAVAAPRRPRSSGGTAPAGTPKPGGNFRLGVTGGGAKDFIDGQIIITKPDQARLAAGWETLLTYDENYKLGTDGLAEEVTQDKPDAVDDPAQERDRVQQRQDAHGRRRHLLAAAHR